MWPPSFLCYFYKLLHTRHFCFTNNVMTYTRFVTTLFIVACLGLPLTGCSAWKEGEASYPKSLEDERRERRGSLTGEGGIQLFSTKEDKASPGSTGIGVNTFLWRATLDTLSFMPLASVDPHGGVIITDWYEDPNARGERFKINVVILGTELRSDGVRVSVFRQEKANGEWRDSTVSATTPRDIESKILTRARELRIQSQNN